MERQRQSGRYGHIERAVEYGCRAVLQQLEQRRLLSADGLAEGEEEIVADDAITMELMVEDGEVQSEDGGGEIPEEWMYLTMVGEDDGEVVPADEGEILYTTMDGEVSPEDEILYTTAEGEDGEAGALEDYNGDGVIDQLDEIMVTTAVGEDGEPLPTDDGGLQDWNGDGVIDEQDEIMVTTALGGAPATLKSNGRLVIRGTSGDDTIDVARNGTKIVATVNGTGYLFDAADVTSIKVKARGGNDDVTIDADLDAHVNCGRGNDTVVAGDGDDTVNGGKGDDDLSGGDGEDRLRGGRGKDELNGDDGADDLGGGLGADNCNGGLGDDAIRGGRGKDHVDAGDGNDLLDGGAGADRMMAGAGTDAEQDTLDDILDTDAEDDLFSSLRIAMPDWWDNESGDAAQGIDLPSDTDDTLAPEDEVVA